MRSQQSARRPTSSEAFDAFRNKCEKSKDIEETVIKAYTQLVRVDSSFAMFKKVMAYLQKYNSNDFVHLAYEFMRRKLFFDHVDDVYKLFIQGPEGHDNDVLIKDFLSHILDGGHEAIDEQKDNADTIAAVQRYLEISPKHVVKALLREDAYKYVYNKYFKMMSIDPILKEIAIKRNVILSRLRKNKQTGELFMKECRNAETLGALEWTGVPEARRYGPMFDGYCYDVKELCTIIVSSFEKGIWPTSPYTKNIFTVHQLQDIVDYMVKNNVKHTSLLPLIVYGIKNGYIPLIGIHGKDGYQQRFNFYTAIRQFLSSPFEEFILNEGENWN